jgi:hypothetical protein
VIIRIGNFYFGYDYLTHQEIVIVDGIPMVKSEKVNLNHFSSTQKVKILECQKKYAEEQSRKKVERLQEKNGKNLKKKQFKKRKRNLHQKFVT